MLVTCRYYITKAHPLYYVAVLSQGEGLLGCRIRFWSHILQNNRMASTSYNCRASLMMISIFYSKVPFNVDSSFHFCRNLPLCYLLYFIPSFLSSEVGSYFKLTLLKALLSFFERSILY